ncbi:hypothetical protein QVD17_22550 [Tagetes erecta]|uniref:Uncharacterized protein n=1 Tax=Tagetes erecta TaxID=13708 RepID=A0AAD8NTM6_TARER|nr:hypothetical protein QVD17_22550 [Tagetes erecta]
MKELPGKDTKGEATVETAGEEKSSSTTSNSSNEEAKKCMDALDFFTQKTKGIVIETNKPQTESGKSKRKAPDAVAKKRKRARSDMKKSMSLRSGLNEIGMSFDSDSEPTNADVVAQNEQKGKEKVQEECDVFQGSDTHESDEACKRMPKGRNNDDSDDENAPGSGGGGTGAGAGAHTGLSSRGVQAAGN